MRFTTSQTSFKSGRLSPKLFNRVDTNQYKDGASIIEGFRILPEGGVTRIKGTRAISIGDELLAPETIVGTKDFSFLVDTTSVYGFIDQAVDNSVYARFYSLTGSTFNLLSSHRLVGAGATVYKASLFDWTFIDNTLIITHFSGTMAPAYISITPNTLATAILRLKTQNTDPDSANNEVSPDTALAAGRYRYPMQDIGSNVSSLTVAALTPTTSRVTGSVADVRKLTIGGTFYWEAIGRADFGDGNLRSVVLSDIVQVTAKPSTTTFDITNNTVGVTNVFTAIGVTTIKMWSYSLWTPRTLEDDGNYPKTVTSHESRVVFGGSRKNPLSLYGSSISSISNFCQLKRPASGTDLYVIEPPYGDTLVTDPYLFTIASTQDSAITWIKSSGALNIGTDRTEYIATGGDTILSALSITVKPQSNEGSDPLSAIVGSRGVFYTSNNGHRMFTFKYNEANGSIASEEVGLLFSDILEEDPIVEMEWCPHISTILLRMKSGHLYGMMDSAGSLAFYDTLLDGVASMTFAQGGELDTEYARGQFVILRSSTYGLLGYEQTYFEDGVDASFVVSDTTDKNAYVFLDNLISVETLVGAGKLMYFNGAGIGFGVVDDDGFILVPKYLYPDGEMVFVNQADKTTIAFTATTFQENDLNPVTGVDYWIVDDATINTFADFYVGKKVAPCKVATMPVEAGQQWGTAQMGVKNIDALGIRHYKTYSYEISSDDTNWQEVVVADDVGACTNGRADRKFTASPKHDQIVYLRNTKAEPCTIIGINMRGTSNDG